MKNGEIIKLTEVNLISCLALKKVLKNSEKQICDEFRGIKNSAEMSNCDLALKTNASFCPKKTIIPDEMVLSSMRSQVYETR